MSVTYRETNHILKRTLIYLNVRIAFQENHTLEYTIFIYHLSGQGRAIDSVCVYVSVCQDNKFGQFWIR